MSGGRRALGLGVAALAAVAVGALVALWPAAPPDLGPRRAAVPGRAGPRAAAPDDRREPPLEVARMGDARGDPPAVTADVALVEHAAVAAPAWRAAAEILAHSPHPELQELASGFAARLDAAARGIDAPARQELVNEERQLLHFLKTRYAGLEPLERALAPAEQSLDRLQAAQQAEGLGPSPRPPGATDPP